MTEEVNLHNESLNKLLNEITIEGQGHKLKLELYLLSVEDGIESGLLEGRRRQKAEEIADGIQWSLRVLEEAQTMLTSQNNIQNNLQGIIRALS